MREQLEIRLGELREEFENGQKMLTDLEKRKANLSETLLRISGAIQVVEEELGRECSNIETSNLEKLVNQ